MAELLYDLLTSQDEPIPYLIGNGILPVKGKLILAGPPKSNKSWLALNMAISLAKGKAVFDAYAKETKKPIFPVYQRSRVLIFEQEMGRQGSKDRLRQMLSPEESLGLDVYLKSRDVMCRMDTQEGKEAVEAEIASTRPHVVFADTMSKMHGVKEDSSEEMGRVLRFTDFLIEKYELSWVWVHHSSKPSNENPRMGGDRIRGSSAIFGDVDSAILVNRKSAQDHPEPILELEFELRRSEPMAKKYMKRRRSGLVEYVGDSFTTGG
jgi:RecA-family ATPase